MDPIRASVVTISDKGYAGLREDVSGPLLARLLQDMGADVVRQTVVPDERDEIVRLLVTLADETLVERASDELASGKMVLGDLVNGQTGSRESVGNHVAHGGAVRERMAMDLIVTTGGTGVTPRDVTPEATKAVVQREMLGLAEALRFTGYGKTPLAVISRGVAGIRGQTLIINLPGSPNAVRDGMATLAPILPHVIRMIRGQDTEHDHEGDS